MPSGRQTPTSWAPWVRVSTPALALPFVVSEFALHTGESIHPWAQLTIRYFLASSFRPAADSLPPSLWWPDNTPVSVSYGATGASSSVFVGYVVAPELLNNPGQPSGMVGGQWLDVRYTLLGATKPLQTAQTRTWRQCTVAYMTQQIAALNGLAAVTDPHSRVFDSRQQSAQSDMAFLQDRAAESGYRLVVDGTTLYMTDPRKALVSGVPSYVQHRTPGAQDTMQHFRAVVGETDPSGAIRAQHTAVALSWNGVLTSVTTSAPRVDPVSGADVAPQVSRYASSYVATSYADATAITQAAAHRDLWWVSATATVDGDPRLKPGCVISVGGDAIASQYAGAWMVRSAHHRISIDLRGPAYSSYYVDVELGRDQSASLTRVPSPPVQPSGSVLVGSTWRAGGVV